MSETPKELDAAVKLILDYKPPCKPSKDKPEPPEKPPSRSYRSNG